MLALVLTRSNVLSGKIAKRNGNIYVIQGHFIKHSRMLHLVGKVMETKRNSLKQNATNDFKVAATKKQFQTPSSSLNFEVLKSLHMAFFNRSVLSGY